MDDPAIIILYRRKQRSENFTELYLKVLVNIDGLKNKIELRMSCNGRMNTVFSPPECGWEQDGEEGDGEAMIYYKKTI